MRKSRNTKTGKLERKLEKLWREAVLKKSGGRCVFTGKKGSVDAAHIIGRNSLSTKFDLDNGLAVDHERHMFYHANPTLWAADVLNLIGKAKYTNLLHKASLKVYSAGEEWFRLQEQLLKEQE